MLILYGFSAPLPSASELLRFLSRMAASKPTSWVFVENDFLLLSIDLETLDEGLGCFPLEPRA